MNTFDRYAPFIQEYIYRNRWDDLRTVQNEACTLLMDTEDHVIIASGTASGKTEAAFFPVLTLLCNAPSASVSVLYISPLRALINDQFERLDLLLRDSHIPVCAWHGESSRSARAKVLAKPEGIVQITPESLEALVTDHPEQAAVLFADLRFVMIDELHAMAGTDRGLQLQCLLTRLERISGCLPRRIGLSATLQDYAQAAKWLGAGSSRNVSCAGLTASSRKLSLALEVFGNDEDKWEFLYRQVYRRKCLIFTNSRNGAEEAVHRLREIAAVRCEPDIFHLHHGSLSKELRRETELAMKSSSGPVVTAATMTLELGIDIGDLDCIVQIGPPASVSGFVQRLGRSGRRSGRSRMLFLEEQADNGNGGPDSLPWDFLQTCSVILLYLEERWIEPFVSRPKPFSLLAHQTLAALKNTTGLRPAALARTVLTLPAFSETITAEEYQQLLRHMLEKDYLERMEDGTLIIGLEGEKYASSYEFYSVFKDTASWTVRWEDRILGTLEECPQGDTAFVLSGRSWQVTYADKGSHTIYVKPALAGVMPRRFGRTGDVHSQIVARIRKILEEDTIYPFLGPAAGQYLREIRKNWNSNPFHDQMILPDGPESFWFCPWSGSRETETLRRLLTIGMMKKYYGPDKEEAADQKETSGENPAALYPVRVDGDRFVLHIRTDRGIQRYQDQAADFAAELDPENPSLVLDKGEAPECDKYDFMVPPALLRSAFLHNQLAMTDAVEILRQLRKDCF